MLSCLLTYLLAFFLTIHGCRFVQFQSQLAFTSNHAAREAKEETANQNKKDRKKLLERAKVHPKSASRRNAKSKQGDKYMFHEWVRCCCLLCFAWLWSLAWLGLAWLCLALLGFAWLCFAFLCFALLCFSVCLSFLSFQHRLLLLSLRNWTTRVSSAKS